MQKTTRRLDGKELPPWYLRPDGHYYGRPDQPGEQAPPYFPHPDLLAAANAALVLNAPLLLTGEPGCGKSQFAWAMAGVLGRPEPLTCYVRSDTRARDLLYYYDAVRRFGDAQSGQRDQAAWAHPYVELRPLGKALVAAQREVVLIDEIDKAPKDLPNDLLWELEQGHFEIRELGDKVPGFPTDLKRLMRPAPRVPRPLIIITSNVERQLPDAFLRRCVFFHIAFPDKDALTKIVEGHCGKQGPELLEAVLKIFSHLRQMNPPLKKRPGTAELLHFVRVLREGLPAEEAGRVLQMAPGLGGGTRRWREVPALGCLVKMSEDLHRLCPEPSAGTR